MKRRVLTLVTLVILVLTIGAQAAEPWSASGKPRLTFDGTTAYCSATCRGESSRDSVKATIALYKGSALLDSWSDSGTGSVTVSGQYGVKSGESYTLKLTYSVNGVSKQSVSTSATCP